MENEDFDLETAVKERREFFKDKSFFNTLASQKFNEAIKTKGKWTDNLFPPNDASIYSMKTSFSKPTKDPKVPDFVKVSIFTNPRNNQKILVYTILTLETLQLNTSG